MVELTPIRQEKVDESAMIQLVSLIHGAVIIGVVHGLAGSTPLLALFRSVNTIVRLPGQLFNRILPRRTIDDGIVWARARRLLYSL